MRRLSVAAAAVAAATAEPTSGLERGNRGVPPLGDPPPKSPLKWPRGAFPPLHRWWARVGSMLGSGGLGSSPPVGLARALHPSAPSLLSAWPGSR